MEELTVILASDHLNVPKEDMVFEAARLWLDRCPTRRHDFHKVRHFSFFIERQPEFSTYVWIVLIVSRTAACVYSAEGQQTDMSIHLFWLEQHLLSNVLLVFMLLSIMLYLLCVVQGARAHPCASHQPLLPPHYD